MIYFVLICIATYIAARSPILVLNCLFLTGIIGDALIATNLYPEDYGVIGGGFFAVDMVLIGMAAASAFKIRKALKTSKESTSFIIYLAAFLAFLLFEVIRNFDVFGWSAPGEFRFRYLVLVIPLYMYFYLETPSLRRSALRALIVISVYVTILVIPIIGFFKGWAVGPENRFLPASASLGVAYGFFAMLVARKYRIIHVQPLLIWITAIPVLLILIVDSHRSVWLASMVVIVTLAILQEIRLRINLRTVVQVGVLFVIALIVLAQVGLPVGEYMSSRASAFVNPEDDPTSNWRLLMWAANLEQFSNTPILGQGFGGYWQIYIPELHQEYTVSPHSLYIQNLIKLGLAGTVLYLLVIGRVLRILKHWIYEHRRAHQPEYVLVVISFVILIASHIYYFVYAYEYYTWLFFGVGIAVLNVGNVIPQASLPEGNLNDKLNR